MKKPLFLTTTPSVGDLISATPTIKKLADIYKTQIIVVSETPDLLKNNPYVEQSLHIKEVNLDSLKKNYDVHESFALIGKRDSRGVEFKHAMCDIRQYHAKDLGFMLTPDEMTCEYWADPEFEFIDSLNLPEKYVVIHPAQTWASRTWKRENWQNLVYELEKSGIFVVSLGKNTGEYSDHLRQEKPAWDLEINHGLNLTNKTSLDQTWHILSKATCVVTMDSGILHLAGTTDTHIIQLGSSIHPSYRAPWRKGTQKYKYSYVLGGCGLHCASDLSYSLRDWGNIQSVSLIHTCLEGKPSFECNPGYTQVTDELLKIFHNTDQPLQTWQPPQKTQFYPQQQEVHRDQKITISFRSGPKVLIEGEDLDPRNFRVFFIDQGKDEIVHESTIKINHWTKASRKWFTLWKIEIWCEGQLLAEEIYKPQGQKILITLGNSSLGDTLAWIPHCLAFKDYHDCQVTIATHHHEFLSASYSSEIPIIPYQSQIEDMHEFYAAYDVGYGNVWEDHRREMNILIQNFQRKKGNLYSDKLSVWDPHVSPRSPHSIPLAQIATDILGLEYQERRSVILNPKPEEKPLTQKYICISEFASDSTGLKVWQNQIGWQKLVDFFVSEGFEVVSISLEKTSLKNVIKRNGKLDLKDRAWYLHHCEFFVGVSSGLSWLAWACGKKVVMISGATATWNEFQTDNIRIINTEVCHGCWNSGEHSHKFACFHGSFCPENKKFECTRKISPAFVIDRIKQENLV
jgi:ADP-heptose:LPS heptosyltransferase